MHPSNFASDRLLSPPVNHVPSRARIPTSRRSPKRLLGNAFVRRQVLDDDVHTAVPFQLLRHRKIKTATTNIGGYKNGPWLYGFHWALVVFSVPFVDFGRGTEHFFSFGMIPENAVKELNFFDRVANDEGATTKIADVFRRSIGRSFVF